MKTNCLRGKHYEFKEKKKNYSRDYDIQVWTVYAEIIQNNDGDVLPDVCLFIYFF